MNATRSASLVPQQRPLTGNRLKSDFLSGGILIALVVVMGLSYSRGARAYPALSWMYIYTSSDFLDASWMDVVRFFRDLRIPIPPLLALAEIISVRLTGSDSLITSWGYRVSLVGAFALAVMLAGSSQSRQLASCIVACVMLYATIRVHPGNPQHYDTFFPFFTLLFILFWKFSTEVNWARRFPLLMPGLAGLFLAMTELTRPFVIYLMPMFIIAAWFTLDARTHLRRMVAFLAPLCLLSLPWHAHLMIQHGQLGWSNHSGYNLARVWGMPESVEFVETIESAPLKEGRWMNLNTAEHTENSKRVRNAIVKQMVSTPGRTMFHVVTRIDNLLYGHVDIYRHRPQFKSIGVYRLAVRLASAWLLIQFAWLISRVVRPMLRGEFEHAFVFGADDMLILIAVASIGLLAVGDAGEEARFLISILPMLAMLPRVARKGPCMCMTAPQQGTEKHGD